MNKTVNTEYLKKAREDKGFTHRDMTKFLGCFLF